MLFHCVSLCPVMLNGEPEVCTVLQATPVYAVVASFVELSQAVCVVAVDDPSACAADQVLAWARFTEKTPEVTDRVVPSASAAPSPEDVAVLIPIALPVERVMGDVAVSSSEVFPVGKSVTG